MRIKSIIVIVMLLFTISAQAQEISSAPLAVNHRYYSPGRNYFLVLQGDGNLVLYTATGSPVWNTKTNGKAVTTCSMQADGNLVLYNGSTPVWDSKTCCYPNNPTKLSVQDDGNLVIFGQFCGNWIPIWTSKSGNSSKEQISQMTTTAFDNGSKTSTIKATGSYQGPSGFDRGMATTLHCGKSPESWVRGSASLDRASGILFVTIQLETDAVDAGPKGKVTAIFYDSDGNAIANATTTEVETGGKLPGSAAIRNFSSQVTIAPQLAKKVCSITLAAQCTGSLFRAGNIPLGTVIDAFTIAVTLL
ncbi:hypothetical protein EXU57_24460 [Segetibacter sp. 3557_3]|uniref:hypothetical protein n=1 Tax=Segetibacter sp. 3557_3 TaxID=2547429 RepID=UPI0010587782|nr:hypothetical protein [Segetibacter sp. 3557_3]TDH18077.1 hypothetical protein EXU57_24460 [Segetibacter sp. 3557_3]